MNGAKFPALLLGAMVTLGFPSAILARAKATVEQALGPDFEAAAVQLEQSSELEALARAAVLRRGLEHFREAAADRERFLVGLSCAPVLTERAASLFLEEVLDEETWSEATQWEAMLRRFIASLPSGVTPSVRIRAQVKLAAALWKRSCPIVGHDGACIERIRMDAECRARRAVMPKLPKGSSPVCGMAPCGCYAGPSFRYVVHERHTGLAQESQRLLSESLRLVVSLQGDALPPGAPALAAIAQAYFLQAEPQFEQALGRTLVHLRPEDGRNPNACQSAKPPSCERPSDTQIKRWLGTRFDYSKGSAHPLRQQRAYERLLALPASRWSTAAHARMGQLVVDAEDQVKALAVPFAMRIPSPPSGISATEWASMFALNRCIEFDLDDLPWSRTADAFIESCYAGSALYPSDDPYTRFCRDAHRIRHPVDGDWVDEVFRQPSQSDARALESVPALSIAAPLPGPSQE